MKLPKSVLVFVVLSIYSVDISESSTSFYRSKCQERTPANQGLVFGGQKSEKGRWPWLVAFIDNRDEKYFCAGSLVSERHILTAAHCLQYKSETTPRNLKDFTVLLGKWNLTDDTEPDAVEATVIDLTIHPDWNISDTRWDADIAIVKLAKVIELNDIIQPICLWTSERQPDKNDGGVVVGWGKTENQKDGEHSDVPHEANLKNLPINDCYETALHITMPRRGLCVGGNGSGPCNGDSGGGLYSAQDGRWLLRGITSMSLFSDVMSCDVTKPAVFTNVAVYADWIEQLLEGEGEMHCRFEMRDVLYYTCHLTKSITSRNAKVVEIQGSHLENRKDSEVKGLRIEKEQKSKYLPIGMGNYFPVLSEYLIQSPIEEISRTNFADLSNLKILTIEDAQLNWIPDDVFYDLPNLEHLYLDGNLIETVNKNTFINNKKLRVLYMQRNKIKTLDSSIFRNNLELEVVDFHSNWLDSIGKELLTPLKSLMFANFRTNICIDGCYRTHSDECDATVEEMFEQISAQCSRSK